MTVRSSCDGAFALLAKETGVVIPSYERRMTLRLQAVGSLENGKARVTCKIWPTTNFDEKTSVPLIRMVTLAYMGQESVLTSPPYSCQFAGSSTAAGDSEATVKARVDFSGEGVDAFCDCHCVVDGPTTEQTGVAARVDYNTVATELADDLAQRAASDDQIMSSFSKQDIGAWFCRTSRKRGYVQCGGCTADVVASKKKEHLPVCKSIHKNKSGKNAP